MTNEELNKEETKMIELSELLTRKYKEQHRGKGRIIKDIRTIRYSTLTTLDLTDNEIADILYYIATKRRDYFINLLNDNSMYIDDIINMLNEYPELIVIIPNKYIQIHKELAQFVIENKEKITFDLLPKELANNVEIQKIYDQKTRIYVNDGLDKKGFNNEWLNEQGRLINYFALLANYPINSKEDYLKIVEEYKNSGLSINQFCEKYKISSVEGFKTLLKRVKDESIKNEEELKKVSNESSKRFLLTAKNIVESILKGEISFYDYITKYYNSFHNLTLFTGFLDEKDSKLLYNIISKEIVDYIINNEYDVKIDRLATLFEADYKSKVFTNVDSDLARLIPQFVKNNSNNVDYKKIVKMKQIINVYATPYSRQIIPNSFQFGEDKYEVTDEKIDETLAYMNDKGIHRCMKTFLYYLKKVLKNEIEYKEETNEEKQEMIETIMILREKLKERTDINDYINTMRQR